MNLCIFSDARSVHVRRIALGLAKRGVGVHICTHKPAEVPGATVERFRVPEAGVTHPFRWRTRWTRHLKEYQRRFDIVHVHFLADWGFTPEMIDRGCFVATPWGSDIVAPPGEGVAAEDLVAARRQMLRHAAVVTAWGPHFAEQVAKYAGIDLTKIALLPLGVELDLFCPDRYERSSNPARHGCAVGFFKGFRMVYGAVHLVRAIPAVVAALPGTTFHLIGGGPGLRQCRDLADELGVADRIRWTPRVPREMLPPFIAEWDLSVIPSLCESFGAAALESSAMKVPVVASDVGGLPETVRDGESGLLVPPERPEMLARAVIALLQNSPRRRKMGNFGRELVAREYDWNVILDGWVRTYLEALDRACSVV